MAEAKLLRDAVLCVAVIERRGDGGERHIELVPVAASWDGLPGSPVEDLTLRPADRVVAVLPAPPGSCAVWRISRGGGPREFTGYEFPGGDHPDWGKLVEKRCG